MAQRARIHNQMNHNRQTKYLRQGIVMIPTLKEEKKGNTNNGKRN